MASPDAVIDTSVLYPKSIRGLLLFSAAAGAHRPGWSEQIVRELEGSLDRKHAMKPESLRALAHDLRTFPDAMIDASAIRTAAPSMPNDPKDRHVLAAAVVAGSPLVVTSNLRHFPRAQLATVGVKPVHPDAYLAQLLRRSPESVRDALGRQAASMGEAGWSQGQLLGHLKGMGRANAMAPVFAARAEQTLRIRALTPPLPPSPRRGLGLTGTRQPPSLGR